MHSLAERTFWPTQRTFLQWAHVPNGWIKFGLTKLGWGQLTKDQQGPAECGSGTDGQQSIIGCVPVGMRYDQIYPLNLTLKTWQLCGQLD